MEYQLTRKCTYLGFKMMYCSGYEPTGLLGLVNLSIITSSCPRKLLFFDTFRGQSFSIARENSCFLAHFAVNHFLLPAKTPIF